MDIQPVIPVCVGYDEREAAVYHAFQQSVIDRSSTPVSFTPLHGPMLDNFDGQQDGTNRFIYSRYLVPALMGFKGWAIFVRQNSLTLTERNYPERPCGGEEDSGRGYGERRWWSGRL